MDGSKKITGIVFAAIFALAITACKVQQQGYVSLYIDNSTSVTDTFDPGEAPFKILDTALTRVIDTTSVIKAELPVFLNSEEEIVKISSDSVYQYEVEKLLSVLNDSIQLLEYQLTELQQQLAELPDTSFSGKKPQEFQPVDSQQTEYLSQKLRREIQLMQNQLNAMQKAAARTPQQTYIHSEPFQVQPFNVRQTDPLTLQLFQAQNDTIQFLKSQLWNLQLQPRKIDSVYIEKEANEMQPVKELVAEQKTSDLQVLLDTIQVLKSRVLSLEEQTLPVKKTPALAVQDETEAPVNAKTDTILIVAFYGPGKIKPLEEEALLNQIKKLYTTKNTKKITLSGYTDSSGNATINKEITTKRLNYLSEKINPWFSKEKMFYQNFGDAFASDTMVNDERRIEIRILTE